MNANYFVRHLVALGEYRVCSNDGRLIAGYWDRNDAERHAARLNARWHSGLPISR